MHNINQLNLDSRRPKSKEQQPKKIYNLNKIEKNLMDYMNVFYVLVVLQVVQVIDEIVINI